MSEQLHTPTVPVVGTALDAFARNAVVKRLTDAVFGITLPEILDKYQPIVEAVAVFTILSTGTRLYRWYRSRKNVKMMVFHLIHVIELNEEFQWLLIEDPNQLMRRMQTQIDQYIARKDLAEAEGVEAKKELKRKVDSGNVEDTIKRSKGTNGVVVPSSRRWEGSVPSASPIIGTIEDGRNEDGYVNMHDAPSIQASSFSLPPGINSKRLQPEKYNPLPFSQRQRSNTKDDPGESWSFALRQYSNTTAKRGKSSNPPPRFTPVQATGSKQAGPSSSTALRPSPKSAQSSSSKDSSTQRLVPQTPPVRQHASPPKQSPGKTYGFNYEDFSSSSSDSLPNKGKHSFVARATINAFNAVNPAAPREKTPVRQPGEEPLVKSELRKAFDAIDPYSPVNQDPRAAPKATRPRRRLSETPPNTIKRHYGIDTGTDLSPVDEGDSTGSIELNQGVTPYRVTRGFYGPKKAAAQENVPKKSIRDFFVTNQTAAVRRQIEQEESSSASPSSSEKGEDLLDDSDLDYDEDEGASSAQDTNLESDDVSYDSSQDGEEDAQDEEPEDKIHTQANQEVIWDDAIMEYDLPVDPQPDPELEALLPPELISSSPGYGVPGSDWDDPMLVYSDEEDEYVAELDRDRTHASDFGSPSWSSEDAPTPTPAPRVPPVKISSSTFENTRRSLQPKSPRVVIPANPKPPVRSSSPPETSPPKTTSRSPKVQPSSPSPSRVQKTPQEVPPSSSRKRAKAMTTPRNKRSLLPIAEALTRSSRSSRFTGVYMK
ncbi:hypothetical protein P280DRAFT_518092 [Massarina eburnea CBS 473.64]|uniref:Uncharacterized protein n=1 Tax=Massarina eburnea CBS 473.64 TaxID=1395130 RepID=A0A6A6RYU5_9PLEO|nr:hypothetical protein P280DRAFT_518092 [Massarina eburnea CBS 473.64]